MQISHTGFFCDLKKINNSTKKKLVYRDDEFVSKKDA
jgi:hypothetical protein